MEVFIHQWIFIYWWGSSNTLATSREKLAHWKITLILGKTEGRRRRGWQRMTWLDGITDLMDMSLSKLWVGDEQRSLLCFNPWGHKELDTTDPLNWTEQWLWNDIDSKRPKLSLWSSVKAEPYGGQLINNFSSGSPHSESRVFLSSFYSYFPSSKMYN